MTNGLCSDEGVAPTALEYRAYGTLILVADFPAVNGWANLYRAYGAVKAHALRADAQ